MKGPRVIKKKMKKKMKKKDESLCRKHGKINASNNNKQ